MFHTLRKATRSLREFVSPTTLDLETTRAFGPAVKTPALDNKFQEKVNLSKSVNSPWVVSNTTRLKPGVVRPAFAAPVQAKVPSSFSRPVTSNEQFLQRAFEVLPGAFTWLVISMLFWAPFVAPWPLAALVVLFDLYWLARSVSSAAHALVGLRKLRKWERIDWWNEYLKARKQGEALVPWEKVHHVVIIPNIHETHEKLRRTLVHLAQERIAKTHITVVLAMEGAEVGAVEKARTLQAEFEEEFAHFFYTVHPEALPGEVKGKSSNEAWAAAWIKGKLVDEMGYSVDNLTVTSCDADSLIHRNYYSCLTYLFSTDPSRHRKFWQAPIFLYNNIWSVPMPIRVVSVLAGLNFLADLCKGHKILFPQSTYTLSLRLAYEVGYWDVDVIPEDWHMFLKCFFHYNGQVFTQPVFLPVWADAVQSTSYFRSLLVRYQQAKRHAWGAIDIPYAVRKTFSSGGVKNWRIARYLWALSENHIVWSTHWFLLALGGAVPPLLAPAQFAPLSGLPVVLSFILTLCLLPLAIMIALDLVLRPPGPQKFSFVLAVSSILQWFLLPVTSFIFATLPALHAQTQMMVGKRMEYKVTEKA